MFEGVGWVPFEPTPGRGNPAAASTTGVPGAQAAPPEGEAAPAGTSDDEHRADHAGSRLPVTAHDTRRRRGS
ncbi:MAG: hypothetical protein M5U19_07775 [Microthrixaceae bacterium]|nr:hypothetical protein [Microthrixaceae bacterium]